MNGIKQSRMTCGQSEKLKSGGGGEVYTCRLECRWSGTDSANIVVELTMHSL